MSTPNRLTLPEDVLSRMVAHALTERPNECCGLLSGVVEGDVLIVRADHPLVNALASPTEYESDPRSMIAAMRAMWAAGCDVVAVYHSHPTSEAVPSRKDLARNYSEDVVNFIISLTTTPPTVRGWWLKADDYSEADWRTTPTLQ